MKINKNTLIKNSLGRTLGVMLIFVMCFNPSVYALSPNGSAAEEHGANTLVWQNDFDKNTTGIYSGAKTGRVDTEHGKSLMFDTASGASVISELTMPYALSNGIYAISIDYYTLNKHIYNAISLTPSDSTAWNDPKNSYTVSWTPIGDKISSFTHNSGVSMRVDTINLDYINKSWGNVVIWIDFDLRKQAYFVNGKQLNITGMPDGFNNISKIKISQDGANYPGIMYMDNIEVWHISDSTESPIPKESTPEYLSSEISITNSSKNVGNVFYDDSDFNFDTSFKNMGKSGKYTAKYEIIDDYGDTVWNKTEDLFINQNETITRNVLPDVAEYGMYTYRVTVSGNENVSSREFRCSKANVPPKGEKNKNLGVSMHFRFDKGSGRGEPEIVLPLVDIGGFGMIRDETYWTHIEKQEGVYAYTDRYTDMLDFAQSHNIDVLNILGYSNPLYNSNGGVPLSGSYQKAFDNFIDFTVKDMGKRFGNTYFEGWNEFNLNANYTPEQYAVLMKNMHKQIKESDSNAFFVAMCTALTPLDWIERVLIALGDNPSQYMDAVSFHPYDSRHTPESGSIGENSKKLRELLDSYGCQNVEMWYTELGWSSTPNLGFVTEKQQGYYAPRMLLLNDANHYVDKYIWYDFHNDGINANDSESNFGLVRNELEDVPASAKYSYLTVVNYNKLVGNAKFKKEILANDECYIYRYERKGKSDILALGTLEEKVRPTSLYVGCDSVNVIDKYGNGKKISTVNGILTLPLDAYPQYVEGDFCDRIYEVEPLFSIDKEKIITPYNSDNEITVSKRTNLDAVVSIDTPNGITSEGKAEFNGLSAKTVIKSGSGEGFKVSFDIKDGENLVYSETIPIEYEDSIKISDFKMEINETNMRRRTGSLVVTNARNDSPASGKIVFKKPDCMIGRSIEVKDIAPGESKTIKFNFPELSLDVVFDMLSVEFITDTGETVTFDGDMKLPLSVYADKAPTVDGKLSKNEYNYDAQMDISGDSMVGIMQNTYQGHDDLSAVAYSMWDENNFYFATKVLDNVFFQDQPPATAWQGDGIQMAFAEDKSASTGTEIGISIYPQNSDDCAIYCYTHTQDTTKVAKLMSGEAKAKRDGIYTVYEVKIPWSEIFYDGYTPKVGDVIRWSLLYNENDGSGRMGFLQYGAGIGGSKSTAQYLDLELRK
jgi:hypothetical protein